MNIKREIRTWGPFLLLLLLLVGLANYQRLSVRQARLDAKLVAAVHSHDTNAAIDALNAGANPNARDYYCPPPSLWDWIQDPAAAEKQYSGPQHWEPVLTAAIDSTLEGSQHGLNDRIVQALLKRGANVNAQDYEGRTALTAAAWRHGRLDWVTDLLNRGATVVSPDTLAGAAWWGDVPLARLLIAHGADVNGRDILGDTPLIGACRYGKTAVARLLLDHGASLSLRGGSGKTALQTAQASRHFNPALLQLLKQKGWMK